MDKGKVSIVVPVYKVEDYLERCILSLVNQTYGNIEIVLVDDGSPDKCPQLCDEYMKTDYRIRVVHIKHLGLSAARNAGIMAAGGKYIMFVDSDDYIEPASCEKLVSYMDDDVDIVIGAMREVNEGRIKCYRHSNLTSGRKYSSKGYVLSSIKKNEWYPSAALNLTKKDFLLSNCLFYKAGSFYEDVQMLPRLFLAAATVVYVDYPFYNYCVRPNSIITSGYSDEKRRMVIGVLEDWMHLFSQVRDPRYQRILYGVLIQNYLYFAKKADIDGWKVEGLDYSFARKNALNMKERMKTMLFNYSPRLYRSVAALLKGENNVSGDSSSPE